MILPISPWVAWAVLSLALFGLVFLWRLARAAAGDAWAWWRRDRVGPLLEDETYCYPECPAGCDCSRLELPPERSAEALGFTGSDRNADDLMDGGGRWHGLNAPESAEVRQWRGLEARRERLASAAELEHRAAYEAMGLEYPSGLMARVREAAP